MIEQRDEIGVISLVINDKTCIDGLPSAGNRCFDRIAVTTDAVLFFENGDVVTLAQEPGGGQSRNSAADYRDRFRADAIHGWCIRPAFLFTHTETISPKLHALRRHD